VYLKKRCNKKNTGPTRRKEVPVGKKKGKHHLKKGTIVKGRVERGEKKRPRA